MRRPSGSPLFAVAHEPPLQRTFFEAEFNKISKIYLNTLVRCINFPSLFPLLFLSRCFSFILLSSVLLVLPLDRSLEIENERERGIRRGQTEDWREGRRGMGRGKRTGGQGGQQAPRTMLIDSHTVFSRSVPFKTGRRIRHKEEPVREDAHLCIEAMPLGEFGTRFA